MIELGRYQTGNIPREKRICPLCKSNQVENESHFLIQCNKYTLQRHNFFNQINKIIPDIDRKSTAESINPRGGDSNVKKVGVLVVSLRGVNFRFWSRLGC